MKKTMILLLAFFLNFTAFGFIELNDIVPVFPPGDQASIEGAVIQGAVHFLQAKSYADLVLAEYEKSAKQSFDYPGSISFTESAIAQVEKSINEYHQAITIGKRAGYVNEKIQKFKNFNYDTFAFDRKFNKDIMTVVTAYFSGGNIVGVYQQKVEYLGEILITLNLIKEKLTAHQYPDISLYWQLLQQFSHAALFGNYCTVTAVAILAE